MSDFVENPFRPTTRKMAMLIAAGISALLFVWWAGENFGPYRLVSISEGILKKVDSTKKKSRLDEVDRPLPLLVPLGVTPLLFLGVVIGRYTERRLAREGVRITAHVVNASTVSGVHVVALRYTLDGKTLRRNFDVAGPLAGKLGPPDEVEILITKGLFGMVHILGRTRIHELSRNLQIPKVTPAGPASR